CRRLQCSRQSGVPHHFGGAVGMLLVQVCQHDVLAHGYAPGDSLSDGSRANEDNHAFHAACSSNYRSGEDLLWDRLTGEKTIHP
ncbi:MAG TPA: hypothetical protein VNT02_11445, partial [Burkholderiales bacterium]|nr:hypothetical protein [Burkholderiales bacterium]